MYLKQIYIAIEILCMFILFNQPLLKKECFNHEINNLCYFYYYKYANIVPLVDVIRCLIRIILTHYYNVPNEHAMIVVFFFWNQIKKQII